MFTGIVEEVGEVLEIEDRGKFRTIRIQGNAVFDDLRTGSSIAVNGVCLTVRTMTSRTFTAEMSGETLDRTSLGSLNNGTIVNSADTSCKVTWTVWAISGNSCGKMARGILKWNIRKPLSVTLSKRDLSPWTASA